MAEELAATRLLQLLSVELVHEVDVEALYEEYKESGARILEPPENFPWACEMKVGDPDGHVLRFGSDPKEGT